MSAAAIFRPNSAIAQRSTLFTAKLEPCAKNGRAARGWSAMPINSPSTGAVIVTGLPNSAWVARVVQGSSSTDKKASAPARRSPGATWPICPRRPPKVGGETADARSNDMFPPSARARRPFIFIYFTFRISWQWRSRDQPERGGPPRRSPDGRGWAIQVRVRLLRRRDSREFAVFPGEIASRREFALDRGRTTYSNITMHEHVAPHTRRGSTTGGGSWLRPRTQTPRK